MEEKPNLQNFNIEDLLPKSILYLVEQRGGCSWYRCSTPGIGLLELGHISQVLDARRVSQPTIANSKICVWLRPGHDRDLDNILLAQKLGKFTVVDFDDDLWSIDPTNPAYHGWNKNNGEHLTILSKCLQTVDLVTTTTDELAAIASKFNKNVKVLPNMLPDEYWKDIALYEPIEELCHEMGNMVIGWAGSPTHWKDLNLLSGTIETILDRSKAHFVSVGMDNMFDHDKSHFMQFVPLEDLARVYNSFDISLAPVTNTRFNRGKSDLKFLEAAAMGVPSICSKVVTYSRSVKHGENGLLAKNNKDWLKYLKYLINDFDFRITMGMKARNFAETRFISKNAHLWAEAYGLD